MELLQTFLRIVDAGSLSAAAVQLGTTQPTVSRRLQTLESWLGCRLLQRTTHVMNLTEDGHRFYRHARTLLDSWQEMEEDLLESADSPSGLLRVLVPHALGQDHLIPALHKYLTRYPGMNVEWTLHDRRPDFIAEGFDCAIQVGQISDPSVVSVLLAEIPRIVVAAPGLQPGSDEQDVSWLQTLPWLALNTFYRNEVALTNSNNNSLYRLPIEPRLSTDSLYAMRNALLCGMGVGIVSSWVVEEDLAAGRLIHMFPEWQAPELPINLVYPYAWYYPARLLSFMQIMRTAFQGARGVMPRQIT